MKKEQTLLVAAVVLGGAVVYLVDRYEKVGADHLAAGVDMDVRATVKSDPLAGLADIAPGTRSLLRQKRVERRPARPEIDAPPWIGFPWVRPLPWPEVPPAFWGKIRDDLKPVAKPEEKTDTAAAPSAPAADEPDPAALAAADAEKEKAREAAEAQKRVENAAKLVAKDGRPTPCRLTPLGADQGQPVWVILQKWPNVRFLVEELNPDGKSVRGKYEVDGSMADRYQTVHLEKTMENEYHEERIRRGVREGDRQANVDFAAWIRQLLAPKYGIPAVRLALTHLRAAAGQGVDAALVTTIGETCQEAYDLDEEIQAYRDYLVGTRANESAIVVRLGDAYERGGALHAAKAEFDKAAKLQDVEGRLRLATLMLRLADGPADRDAAFAEFEKCAGSSQRARALAGMARARLAAGNLQQALSLATDAKAADAASFDALMVLGAAQYASGRFADAEATFGSAAPLEAQGSTRAKTNQAMAMLAQDKLPEAVALAQSCADSDPLNYFDPLVVLGEAQQRWGDLTRSNDTFQTARQRNPRSAWILARLASIRLRDGLPKQALELVQGVEGAAGLIQVAPESVDALHIAGLASALQEVPDWNGAARFLRRALDKDPANPDLIYDLGKVLHLAGRTEEAIQVLERATDPNVGTAKNDARVLALLSYVYYDGGKPVDLAFATFSRARSGTQAPWTKEWVDRAYQRVFEWNNTRIVEFDFKQSAGDRVGNGWEEVENLGVRIQLDGEKVAFGGTAIPAPDRAKYTGVWRPENLLEFQSAEFVLRVERETGFEFVVHLYQGELPATVQQPTGTGRPPKRSNSAELGLGRDRTGRMMLWIYSGDNKLFNVPVKNADGTERAWPDDGELHRISFRRTGVPAKGEFEIWFDDQKVATPAPIEVGTLSAAAGRTAMLGVHLDADQGAKVRLEIDAVTIEKVLGKR